MPDKYYPYLTNNLEQKIEDAEADGVECVTLDVEYARNLLGAVKDMSMLCELTEDAEARKAKCTTIHAYLEYGIVVTLLVTVLLCAVHLLFDCGGK